jgi:hypothetical protein
VISIFVIELSVNIHLVDVFNIHNYISDCM